jgi:hypothetical protein
MNGKRLRAHLLAVVVVLVVGCRAETPGLRPAETFTFAAQPVSFSPPPKPWESESQSSSGLRGVRYVKHGGTGEAIGVADWYDVSGRLRRVELAQLLDTDPRLESFDFEHAIENAWPRTKPHTPLEEEVATAISDALHKAIRARKERDYATVREQLMAAHTAAERLHFTFEEVIERALFRPETTNDPSRYRLVGRRNTRVAGLPAVTLDHTVETPDGRRYLRKVYTFHNDHLFVAEFIGLEATLPLFDKVVASISYPQ